MRGQTLTEIRSRLGQYVEDVADRLSKAAEEDAQGDATDPNAALRRAIESAEERASFRALAVACQAHLEPASGRLYCMPAGLDGWIRSLGVFLRRSGWYLRAAQHQAWPAGDIAEEIAQETMRTECRTTHLALVEGIELAVEQVQYGSHLLTRLTQNELTDRLGGEARTLFYGRALHGIRVLASHYFLVAHGTKQTGLHGLLGSVQDHWSNAVRWRPTSMPREIQDGLSALALYDWRPVWTDRDEGRDLESRIGWPGLSVPVVISFPDDLFDWPRGLPNTAGVAMEPMVDDLGNEVGYRPARALYELDERATQGFGTCLADIEQCRAELADVATASFVFTASDFLLKASLTRGLEQLLWHVAAIEAVLGETSATESVGEILARRLGRLLGTTKAGRKAVRKLLRTLYGFRSALVHGRKPDDAVCRGHLAEARRLARSAVAWAFRAFAHLKCRAEAEGGSAPERADLLRLVDLTCTERKRVADQVAWVPESFPHVPDWLV